jgi:AraC family transcriptional regulator, regulatory protein of adaptative response / DNA-3-methyladenine glycosylase II
VTDPTGLLHFFALRAVPGVEEVDGDLHRRSLRLAHGAGIVETDGTAFTLSLDDERDRAEAEAKVSALLDLDADLDAVLAVLGDDPVLGRLVRAAPGRRVPGAVDGHELAVRAVLGQQVSLRAARTLAGRLVAVHGEPLARPAGTVTHLFPRELDPATLGMPASRKRALAAIARAPSLDRETLLALPGVGPWTAEYVAMRALRDRDAWLPTDLGVRHALERLGADATAAKRWRPFRAYAIVHLWASLA